MTAVTVPWRKDRPQRMQNVCCSGDLCLVSEAKGFDKGNSLPAIVDGDGRMQRGLPAIGNAVADVFKKDARSTVLDLGAAKIGRQWRKALTDGALAVVIVAMALGAIDQVYSFTAGNEGRLGHIDGGLYVGSGRYPVEGFATVDRNQPGLLDQQRRFIWPHSRCFPHPAEAEVVVIIDERMVNRQNDNSNDDEKSNYFFHLFNPIKRDHVQMLWVFFLTLLFENMLRIGQGIIGIVDCIG